MPPKNSNIVVLNSYSTKGFFRINDWILIAVGFSVKLLDQAGFKNCWYTTEEEKQYLYQLIRLNITTKIRIYLPKI